MRGRLAAGLLLLCWAFAVGVWLSGAFAGAANRSGQASAAEAACTASPPTHVHYRPYRELKERGLRKIPWLAASPSAAGVVGHLFYYGSVPWGRQHLPDARIYTGGRAPTGGNAMKILWIARKAGYSWAGLRIIGAREDGSASFAEEFPADSSGNEFPSIIDIPEPGCWFLTLQTGRVIAAVTFLAVSS